MSVNRKGDKFNFESAPAVSYKTGLKIGEKTCPQGISDLYYYCCCCRCCYKAIKRKHFQVPTIEDITTRMKAAGNRTCIITLRFSDFQSGVASNPNKDVTQTNKL